MSWKDTIKEEPAGESSDAPKAVTSWKDTITEEPEERGIGDVYRDATNVLNWPKNIASGLEKIDEYTGALIRKPVTEFVTGKELDKAPTGVEQAEMMGFSDKSYGDQLGIPEQIRPYVGGNIRPKDIMGVALEAVQDPFLISAGVKSGANALMKAAPSFERSAAKSVSTAAGSQAAESTAESAARSGVTFDAGSTTAEQGGKLFSVQAPATLDELRSWTPSPNASDLPQKGRLKEIAGKVPLSTPPLKYHFDMLENPKAMKEFKLKFENLPTKDAQQIAAYNQQMVNEAGDKVQSTVSSISPAKARGLSEAGDDFITTVKDKYKAEKKELGPMFQQLQKSPPLSRQDTRDLAVAIGENTKLGKLMETAEDGKIFLKKNTPRSGISDHEHSVLSRVIDEMNDGMTFKEIQDTRDFLRKSIDNTNPGASAEIGKVRSLMLGQLEDLAQRRGRDVGDTFKRYAVNERTRENVEDIIGGSIDSIDRMFSANPDRAVKKIFANPNHAKVVGEYVGPEKMQELILSYVNDGVGKSFDSARGFDPTSLRRWIKQNDQFLSDYAPQVKDQLSSYADYGYFGKRFLDEVNPSGTTASLMSAMKPEGFMQKVVQQGPQGALISEATGRTSSKLKQNQAVQALSESLGEAPKPRLRDRMSLNMPPDLPYDLATGQIGVSTARGLIPPSAVASQEPQQEPDYFKAMMEQAGPKQAPNGQSAPLSPAVLPPAPKPPGNIEKAKIINEQRKLQRQSMGL